MHKIVIDTISGARDAGEAAADVCYDALTPETARALRADIVPDFAEEAACVIAADALRVTARDMRGTRFAALVTQAWASAFRDAWPAEAVAALAEEAS